MKHRQRVSNEKQRVKEEERRRDNAGETEQFGRAQYFWESAPNTGGPSFQKGHLDSPVQSARNSNAVAPSVQDVCTC